MDDNTTLKNLLKEEGNFGPSYQIIDMFIDSMEEITLRPKEKLIDFGKTNTDVYCLKEGIIRLFHVEESKEITFGFATPGTIILSPHSYYMRHPAFLIAENCKNEAKVLRMTKQRFDELLRESHEFCQWMLNIAMGQLYTCEHKLYLINGTARDRYMAVAKNRPDIIDAVPSNVIASYLGVTPQYLCKLKKELLEK